LLEQYLVDFVPAKELATLPIDADVKLPDDIQAKIARGKAAYPKFKKSWRKQKLRRSKGPAGGPFFITSVEREEVPERRDAALSAREKQSGGKRGRPPMLFRMRVVLALVDRHRAEGVPFDPRPNSRMSELGREALNRWRQDQDREIPAASLATNRCRRARCDMY